MVETVLRVSRGKESAVGEVLQRAGVSVNTLHPSVLGVRSAPVAAQHPEEGLVLRGSSTVTLIYLLHGQVQLEEVLGHMTLFIYHGETGLHQGQKTCSRFFVAKRV